MGEQPSAPRSLGLVLRNRLDEIMRRWLAIVTRDIGRRDLSPDEYRNAISEYITGISALLEKDGQASAGDQGRSAWAEAAREHGVMRVRQGFNIGELLHEFIVLRGTLIEAGKSEGLIHDDPQATRLTELIDGAIGTAVQSYVDSRDYESRRMEAEHIGFLTHELRNPLTTAMVASSQLRRLIDGRPDVLPVIDLIERSHQRLREMVDAVLLAERLEIGEIKPHPVEITLGDLLHDAITVARAQGTAKGVTLDMAFDPDVLLFVDPGLARSAVQNVLDNAVKYSDDGVVELRADAGSTHVAIHVQDHCHGLSAEELRTIFLPFKRGRTRGKNGSGLGLAIARRAVEAQGGTIQAESTAEIGCHFWLTLPRARH